MRGYMPDAYGTGSEEPVGQVVRLEDTDGDGRMDTSVVFLGGLVLPRAVAVVNEGVLIGEPPNLWLCELPERDALCLQGKKIAAAGPDVPQPKIIDAIDAMPPAKRTEVVRALEQLARAIGAEDVEPTMLFEDDEPKRRKR